MTHRQAPPPPIRRPQPPQVAQQVAAPGHLRPAPEQLLPVHGGFRVRAGEGAPRPPTGTYNFVQLHGATPSSHPVLVSPRLTHAQLAAGKPVVYAGTAKFEKGAMQWWSNYSGTYQPVAAFRARGALPADKFVPWQQLQLGGHAQQRQMLGERKPAGRPESKAETKAGSGAATKAVADGHGRGPDSAAGGAKAPAPGGVPRIASATAAQPFGKGARR